MTKRTDISLWIAALQGKPGGVMAYIGYFDSQINPEQSRIIADLVWSFRNEELTALVATYVFHRSRWEKAEYLGWKPDLKRTFTRTSLFRKSVEFDWVIGICPSVECLQEVVLTGWNLSGNESFIMILAKEMNAVVPEIGRIYQDGLEAIEKNELHWMDYCPFVFSRDNDGLTLRIYTLHLSENELRQKLELFLHTHGINVVPSAKPL